MLTPVALDTETALIREDLPIPPLACAPVSWQGGRQLYHWTEADQPIADLLKDKNVLIVGHTIAYDMVVLMAKDPEFIPLVFGAYNDNRVVDVAIRQKLCDIAGGVYRSFEDVDDNTIKIGYSLKDITLRLTGRKLAKGEDTWRKRYGELIPLPLHLWPADACEYALDDSDATLEDYLAQERNAAYFEDQFRQTKYELWLRLMSAWGIRTDPNRVKILAQRTQQDYDLIATDLRAEGLLRPDKRVRRRATGLVEIEPGARNEGMARARVASAYIDRGLMYPRTDSGAPSIGRDACEKSGDPVLVKYSEFAKLKAVLSKDIPLLMRGAYYPIHAFFETLLETGRTSSKPNLQNPKREGGIRECFVPTRDCVFVSADYGALELCTLAQVCYSILGYSTLGDAINGGLDPHLEIAAQILDIPYEYALALKKADSDEIDKPRQTGKVANFGFPGGLGIPAFVHFAWNNYRVELTEEFAGDLKHIWINRWAEMPEYFRFINSQVNKPFPSVVQLFSGRQRGGLSYTEACNTYFQGLGADVAKAAGWLIVMGCYLDTESPLFGFRIVNFVHDEFILEGPESRAHDAAIELSRLMKVAAAEWLPSVPGIQAVPCISRRWSKKMKPTWKDGRLIPWDLAA